MNPQAINLSGRCVSKYDLRFSRAPVTQYTSNGSPWVKQVAYGMPQIPREFLNSAFFLYRSRKDAETGRSSGGTGFFLQVPSDVFEGKGYRVACSNHHVVFEKSGASVLRIPTGNGGFEVIDKDCSEWESDAVEDVAFTPLLHSDSPPDLLTTSIAMPNWLTREEAEEFQIGPGDDAFMIGRFVDQIGAHDDVMLTRCGNISSLPVKVPRSPGGKALESYCLDMRSRKGFSGSPVFCYRTPFRDLADAISHNDDTCDFTFKMWFLGMHCGQFPESWPVKHRDGSTSDVEAQSGMTMVAPAWRIREVIMAHKSIRDMVATQDRLIQDWYDEHGWPINLERKDHG